MSSYSTSLSLPPIVVLVTGAAGRIGYSLVPLLLNGSVFGPNRRVSLRLFDIPVTASKLTGLKMEIEDSDYALLHDVVASTDAAEAYPGVEVAIMVGGVPRMNGMERNHMTVQNAENMKQQAIYLEHFASANTKVVVVANPANTNCLVAMKYAPKIPKANFSCLTRLDQQRLKNLCALTLNLKAESLWKLTSRHIKDVYIFGNHSTTQVAYIDTGVVSLDDGSNCGVSNIRAAVTDEEYADICKQVQGRGGAVLKASGASSALSAAEAVAKHLCDICNPILPSDPFSMGISSDENPYGIPAGLVFSFPCRRFVDGTGSEKIEIVGGFNITAEVQAMLEKTVSELEGEKADVAHLLM